MHFLMLFAMHNLLENFAFSLLTMTKNRNAAASPLWGFQKSFEFFFYFLYMKGTYNG